MYTRGHNEGVCAKPTAAQMVPLSRHWTSRDLIFARFTKHFDGVSDFNASIMPSAWCALGALKHNRTMFVPGTLHGGAPYSLSDAVKLAAYALHGSRVLGTRAAVLFHWNYPE